MNTIALLLLQSLIIVWLAINIWQRRKAQKSLQKSENTLRRAQKVAGLGFWETQFDSECLTWSEEVYRMFGLRPEEFDNTREAFYRLVHPEDRQRVRDLFERAARGRGRVQPRSPDCSLGRKRLPCSRTGGIAPGCLRPAIGMLGIVLDISRRKQAEEEREALRQLSQN
jgi:PAS domain S-box-containing protein